MFRKNKNKIEWEREMLEILVMKTYDANSFAMLVRLNQFLKSVLTLFIYRFTAAFWVDFDKFVEVCEYYNSIMSLIITLNSQVSFQK